MLKEIKKLNVRQNILEGVYTPKTEWPGADFENKPEIGVQKRKFRAEETKLNEQMARDCEKQFSLNHVSRKKKDLLWELAYRYGHSDGLAEVLTYYEDLMELVR